MVLASPLLLLAIQPRLPWSPSWAEVIRREWQPSCSLTMILCRWSWLTLAPPLYQVTTGLGRPETRQVKRTWPTQLSVLYCLGYSDNWWPNILQYDYDKVTLLFYLLKI